MLAIQQMSRILTFQVKEHIGSIILEHLSNKFDVHVLDVDLLVKLVPALAQDPWQAGSETEHCTYLQRLIQDRYCFVQFLLKCLSV